MLDDFEHAQKADPGFAFIPAFARVMGLCAIRLADADRLPLDHGATAEWIAGALARLEHGGAKLDRAKLDPALAKLRDAAAKAKAPADPAACDAALVTAERGFTDERGLAGRPWYRHVVLGPDPANGYGPLPLPELAAAKDAKQLAAATDRLAAAIERVAAALAPCAATR
jgi:N-acetylated-alpha-linked acidic dipeptidase